MAAQKQAEDGVRAAGGGDALDAAKEKAADGIPIGFGKTFDIPDLATKGGECHVGVKYMCVESKTVDAQFCAIEFNKKGEKLGSASYDAEAAHEVDGEGKISRNHQPFWPMAFLS